jgi:hypothetical protein
MTREVVEYLVWALICLIVAAWLVKRFVAPWTESEDKSMTGRAANVIDVLERERLASANAHGSPLRTLKVAIVNVAMLGLMVWIMTTFEVFSIALYPIIGWVMLSICPCPARSKASAVGTLG